MIPPDGGGADRRFTRPRVAPSGVTGVNDSRQPSSQRLQFGLAFVPASLVLVFVMWRVPTAIALYQSLGFELPAATRLLFDGYLVLGLLPWTFVLAWAFWPRRETRGTAALCTSVALSALVLAFGTWAMNLPLAHVAESI
jgi:hypothetical protein